MLRLGLGISQVRSKPSHSTFIIHLLQPPHRLSISIRFVLGNCLPPLQSSIADEYRACTPPLYRRKWLNPATVTYRYTSASAHPPNVSRLVGVSGNRPPRVSPLWPSSDGRGRFPTTVDSCTGRNRPNPSRVVGLLRLPIIDIVVVPLPTETPACDISDTRQHLSCIINNDTCQTRNIRVLRNRARRQDDYTHLASRMMERRALQTCSKGSRVGRESR